MELSADYEQEQAALKARLAELQTEQGRARESAMNKELVMHQKVQQQIVQFNLLFKRYGDIYRSTTKKFDMPDLALWILYALREKPDCTQNDIVRSAGIAQTVYAHGLEKAGE